MRVKQEYRTNWKSKVTGGVIVVVEFDNGQILEYDNIKNPTAYINAISSPYKKAWVKQPGDINDNIYFN